MNTSVAVPRKGIEVTPKRMAFFLGGLLGFLAIYLFLEFHFSHRDQAGRFPAAPTPSLFLEIKQVLGLQEFHSQWGQDKWIVACVFPGVRDGYYVDIGCADGVRDSNTKALEDLGWTGIGIDPFPTNWDQRKGQLFREVVYSKKGEVVKFRQAGTLGGIDKHLGLYHDALKEQPLVEFTTTTIGDILERAKAPSFIHYVSLDTEGAEFEILRAFPFSKYRVGAFTIEHNGEEPKRSQIRQLLEKHGYRLERQHVVDDWYVRADS